MNLLSLAFPSLQKNIDNEVSKQEIADFSILDAMKLRSIGLKLLIQAKHSGVLCLHLGCVEHKMPLANHRRCTTTVCALVLLWKGNPLPPDGSKFLPFLGQLDELLGTDHRKAQPCATDSYGTLVKGTVLISTYKSVNI
nr:hypothetical protein Iba_chr10aCG7380 [Ipomoea batatas]